MLRRIGYSSVIVAVGLACGIAVAQPSSGKPTAGSNSTAMVRTVTDEMAQDLTIGSNAPALYVDKWVKGEPVTGFEKGRTYLVEFWATWCAPCRKSIPHLTSLHNKFKDRGLSVIGISSEEGGLAEIEPFVAKLGDKMNYAVAFDKDGASDRAWLRASRAEGIPTAFIIDPNSKVAWIGHPMDSAMEKALEQILAGTFNLEEATNAAKRKAEAQAQAAPLMTEVATLIGSKDYGGAVAKLDELIALDPASMTQAGYMKFNLLVTQEKKYDAAYGFARQTFLNGPMNTDAQLLNAVAWTILDSDKIAKRDLPLAEQLAKRANDLSGGAEPAIMDTYARALFENGKKSEAVKLQTKAVGLADGPELKKELEQRLATYTGNGG